MKYLVVVWNSSEQNELFAEVDNARDSNHARQEAFKLCYPFERYNEDCTSLVSYWDLNADFIYHLTVQ